MVGDVEDELHSDWRQGAGPNRDQEHALREARQAIAQTKAALNNAARWPQRGCHGRGAFYSGQRYADAMKARSLQALLLTILPSLVLAASGCTPTACPAVGFVNLNPLELDVSGLPAGTTVSACFGVNDHCDPAPVTRDSAGRWLVPQTPPFVHPDNAPTPLPRIRVAAVKPDQSISDRLYGIEHTPPRGGCDNTYDLIPVKVL